MVISSLQIFPENLNNRQILWKLESMTVKYFLLRMFVCVVAVADQVLIFSGICFYFKKQYRVKLLLILALYTLPIILQFLFISTKLHFSM